VIVLLVLNVLLQGQACILPVKAQTQPVIATDYSFYKGPLDATHRPITRVNGYLRNDSQVSFWVALAYVADMPEAVVKSEFYAPDGKFVQEEASTLPAYMAGGSAVWYFESSAIREVKNNAGIWKVEIYYGPYHLFAENFSIGDYLVDVSIAGLPRNLAVNVAIDDEEAGTIRGGEEKPSAPTLGTHAISVNGTVALSGNVRYVADSNYAVVSSRSSHIFQYRTEYYVDVEANSPYGITKGSGWYIDGTNITFSGNSPLLVSTGTRYVFTSWTGDYVGRSPEGSILVNGPKNILANYRVQYYLQLKSEYGNPEGEGWYDAGSTANASVPQSFVLPYGTKISFLRWSGDVNSSENSVTIFMDRPHSATAEWEVVRPSLPSVTSLYLVLGGYVLIVTIAVALVLLSIRRRHWVRRGLSQTLRNAMIDPQR
jgi:hypothetical protein